MLQRLFPSRNARILGQYQKTVQLINALESHTRSLSDEQLRAKTATLRAQAKATGKLEPLLPECFALVREVSRRVLGLRHYDVQLMGGLALVQGKIPEMRTGEGKTLVAILGAYALALLGKGVHVVTVNPYLAQRDAETVRPVHEFLGLTVRAIYEDQTSEEKREAYAADITYGTHSEFGFDFLRDNLVMEWSDKVQRGHFAAIVDEVDSVLIDESRTPLIISGMSQADETLLPIARRLALLLERQRTSDGPGDVFVDEKEKRCVLSEQGFQSVETYLHGWGVLHADAPAYQHQHLVLMGMLDAALKAAYLYERDVDYLVHNDEIVIVDAFTGRLQEGRRWSEGLHQAIEVKEGVPIQGESVTLSSITYQNYFRMYPHLSGMTGTAMTEAREFFEIYQLESVAIPTHRKVERHDHVDLVYATEQAKLKAVVADIQTEHAKGRPVLVGTTSVEQSEALSTLLKSAQLPHEVLNAKNHAREAGIIAQAGRRGAITIATNMAGRGTDILLGGNVAVLQQQSEGLLDSDHIAALWTQEHADVVAAGGLHVIGTERHESRRVDNQLRGRAGRQGDPGSSRFYLSLEDNLLRVFGGDRFRTMVAKMGLPNDEAIASGWLSKAIESAQMRVEQQHYDIRKQLLEYDDVPNQQRTAFYSQRDDVLRGQTEAWEHVREGMFHAMLDRYIPLDSFSEQWDLTGAVRCLNDDWDVPADIPENADDMDAQELRSYWWKLAEEQYAEHIGSLPLEVQRQMLASTVVRAMDIWWQRHLTELDRLREGIHLRAYAQQEPKTVYKKEAYAMFETMVASLRMEAALSLQRSRVILALPSEGDDWVQAPPVLEQLPA